MQDLNGLFDAFYTKFVLRDFFAKIIPGLLLLFASAVLLLTLDKTMSYLEKIPVWGWLVIYGFGWIVGFAIQALGEITHRIRYSPQVYKDKSKVDKVDLPWQEDNAIRLKFEDFVKDSLYKRQYQERMAVIKESCGNAYVALLVFISLLFFSKIQILSTYKEGIPLWSVLVTLMVIALILSYMHIEHVYRQYTVIYNVLKESDKKSVECLEGSISEHDKTSVFKKVLTCAVFPAILGFLFICVAYLYNRYH